jgi:integrase
MGRTVGSIPATGAIDRADFPASGPVIVSERTGRPWTSAKFGREWRKIARAVGVPDSVQNRDSRSGAATEADVAGAPRENVQRLLGHSDEATTAGYQRANREIRSQIAQLRAEKRK